jgi:hypothetical protein
MPGLIDSLQALLSGSGVDAQVSIQIDGLNEITQAIGALTAGPAALDSLKNAAGALPAPPGLQGIGNLATSLGSLQVPTDVSGLLAPILSPITGLNFSVSGTVQIAAAFDVVREIIRVGTGRAVGGPTGMPEGSPAFRMQDAPSPEELRAFFVTANGMLDDVGPNFDAARILQLLQRAATGYGKPHFWIPTIPFLDDMMEPLATIATWQTMNGQELSASLAGTIRRVGELMLMPRRQVAQPIMNAAAAIAAARTGMAGVHARSIPALGSLREKTLQGTAQPSTAEVIAVEQAAALLEQLAAAVDPSVSPLASHSLADERLTRALLAVIRALEPSYSISSLSQTLQGGIAEIPAPPTAFVDDVVSGIAEFDLSALTDPLQAVTDAVRDAVQEVENAKESVRQALENALTPVANALDEALNAAGFNDIRTALEGLPNQIQQFVNTEIAPNLESVRSGVSDAVNVVSEAADEFNPEALVAPIRQAVEDVAALLQDGEIAQVFAQLEEAITTAIQAIESIDLTIAADESIDLIGDIEVKVSEIDPSLIPDAAKPLLSQAVQVVTNIDFSVEVGAPLLTEIEQAVQQGPAAVLAAIEEGIDELRGELERFRPSAVIGVALDQPFQTVIDTLRQFTPSDLLEELQSALDDLAGRLNVLDVGAVLDPLTGLHATLVTTIEGLRPSNLLRPVNDAIAAAIEKVFQASGIDTVFAGINEVLEVVQNWTGLLADGRDLLNRAAAMLTEPGDATASVQTLVDDALARLDTVDMARLQVEFTATAAAAASIDRDVIARDVANAFQQAGEAAEPALRSAELAAIVRSAREFPIAELRGERETPPRRRLIVALHSIRASAERLDAATPRWAQLGPELREASGVVQEKLLDYYRVSRIEGASLFADFLNPPQTTAALREKVREALAAGLIDPLTMVLQGFQALSPYARLGADGLSKVLGAVHAKVDSLVGAGGVGGTVDALEDAANLLRGINLEPITQPLDAVFARIQTALDAVNPEPLRAALEAARDAVADLLNVTTLIDQDDIDELDRVYAEAVDKIDGLAPSAIVSETLDPVYEDLLADFLPVLDLPIRLRIAIEGAGLHLRENAVRELARVEAAFDQMLRAIPLGGGAGVSGSVSIGVSGSVG